jgi:hypothetical protein
VVWASEVDGVWFMQLVLPTIVISPTIAGKIELDTKLLATAMNRGQLNKTFEADLCATQSKVESLIKAFPSAALTALSFNGCVWFKAIGNKVGKLFIEAIEFFDSKKEYPDLHKFVDISLLLKAKCDATVAMYLICIHLFLVGSEDLVDELTQRYGEGGPLDYAPYRVPYYLSYLTMRMVTKSEVPWKRSHVEAGTNEHEAEAPMKKRAVEAGMNE